MLAPAAVIAGGLAGALAGAGTGLLGGLVPTPGRIAAGTLTALLLAAASLISYDRLPQINRETEQDLLDRGPLRWALLNGALLGLGFTSRIGYWIWYLLPLGCFIMGSAALGALAWSAYGSVRLGIASLLAWHLHRRPDAISDLNAALLRFRPTMRQLVNPVSTAIAVLLTLWLGL